MKRIGLVVNWQKPRAKSIWAKIKSFCKKRGIDLLPEEEMRLAKTKVKARGKAPRAELVIIAGGDGMLLKAVQFLDPGIPVLGVNLGERGFLMRLNFARIDSLLEKIVQGKYEVENLMMLNAEIGKEKFKVLNDLVIERNTARAIGISLFVGKEKIVAYLADGLIISTPAGSTAYNLSSGGPLVNPALNAFILTPVCPHGFFNRCLVLPPDEVIQLKPQGSARAVIDGQVNFSLKPGTAIKIKKFPSPLKLIKCAKEDFYKSLDTFRK